MVLSWEIAGVIDADYRGNVGVILFNHNDSEFTSEIKQSSWKELIEMGDVFQLNEVIVLHNWSVKRSKWLNSSKKMFVFPFFFSNIIDGVMSFRNSMKLFEVQMDLVAVVDSHILSMAILIKSMSYFRYTCLFSSSKSMTTWISSSDIFLIVK